MSTTIKILKKHAWKELGWERGDVVDAKGAQAHTYFARRATDPAGEFNYILKCLKRQEDLSRRGLFASEANLTRAIVHPGVAKIVDTNAHDYLSPVDLYMVTERINGIDLEQLVREGPLSVADAATVVSSALRIVAHFHEMGAVHRDIKPCHIILRGRNLADPVLIDFGIAYHDDRPEEARTQEGEGRGNRFLIAPEQHTANSAANQSAATDICQCVGLLYFAISGKYPKVLIDDHNKKPHHRLSADFFRDLPAWKHKSLMHIFEVGFAWNPLERWSDAMALANRVAMLNVSEEPAINDSLDRELSAILGKIGDSVTTRYKVAVEMSLPLVELVRSLADAIKDKTDGKLTITISPHIEMIPKTHGLVVNFSNKFAAGHVRGILFKFIVEGTDLVAIIAAYNGSVSLLQGRHEQEVARYPLGSPEIVNGFQPIATKWLLACTSEALGV